MSKTLMKLSVAAFAICTALPALAQDEVTPDTVVATVNGTEITFGQMLLARAALPERFQGAPSEQLWDGLLEQLIQQEALAQSDKAIESKRVELALINERRSLLAAEAINAVAKAAATDEAIAAAYQAQYVEGDLGVEYNASHILVETEEEAKAIAEELRGGADFTETAQAKSTGPSGPSGGALGWFGKGRMVAPFEEAVVAMEPGTISDPVQTQFGWHVIRLNETRAIDAPPLDQVRDALSQQVQRDAVQAFIDDLVDGGEVTRMDRAEIDTSVINNLGLLGD
ncbi:peptidylprolyl isomerase [Maliponia aquimaris]|uniref:Parvulin-like PPIase n=1 Tax=Maliponia aquimaris TaxID=1673631 RepID=A0A238JT11_9RHOB|nr:peptidylprolyl isomerase [Maliponia aquimaris]SMX33818.1 putative parvulin-type peptidyl-prolyl cis-trans isomerase precursor [Maliponia aquimaris]